MNNNDLLIRVKQNYIKLSKGQKRIADYILENYDKVAFMTASHLGDIVGVSESTVVRFANALGYEGYPQLQKGLQESIKTKLTSVQRFELSKDFEKEPGSYVRKIMAFDIENTRRTMENLDETELEAICDTIHNARKVYILGMRSSSVLANYLGFYLNYVKDNVHIIEIGVHDVFDYLINMNSEDVLISISFPRYAKRTYEIVNFAKEQGATIIGITDSLMSPLAPIVKHCLYAKYNMNTFIDSLVAPMSLINALIIALSIKEKDRVEQTLERLEAVWNEHNVYSAGR